MCIRDRYVTATSPRSRNRTLGEMLGSGKTLEEALDEMHMVAEGVRATRMFVKIAPKLNIEIPFLYSLSLLLDGKLPVEEAVREMVASYEN